MLSQTTDTICLPVPVAKKIYAAAAQKRVADSLLAIAETRSRQLQGTIDLLNEKDKELNIIYAGQMDFLRQEITLYKDQVKGFELLLKKEKRRRRLATAGGILTTGVMAYLFLVK